MRILAVIHTPAAIRTILESLGLLSRAPPAAQLESPVARSPAPFRKPPAEPQGTE